MSFLKQRMKEFWKDRSCRRHIRRPVRSTIVICLLLKTSLLWSLDDPQNTEEFFVKDLKVIFRQKPENEIISVQLFLNGGVSQLDAGHQGIEQLIFSCLTLKDKKYAGEKWNKIFSGVGAQINSLALRDYTVMAMRCTREYFDDLWQAYADLLLKSAFFEYRVQLVRDRMLAQIAQRQDNPDVHIRDLAEEYYYRDTRQALSPLGVKESLSKITINEMKSHFKERLKKENLLLVVVGDLEKSDLEQRIKKTFAKLKNGRRQTREIVQVDHHQPGLKVVERDLATNYVLGLFSAPNPLHPDYYAMTIAMDILKWRLFEEIRTKRNLSYAPDAFMASHAVNYAGIYATSVNPDSTVRIMHGELDRLKTEPVSETDLQHRINLYLTRYYLDNESNSAQGMYLAQLELSGLGWQEAGRVVDRLKNVTPADLQRVAQKYFRNIQFVYLGNPDLIEKKLFTAAM